MSQKKIKILFVCMANICRSPTLQGVFSHLLSQKKLHEKVEVDSAGIGWFHLGQPPDRRAFESAKKRGILLDHKARQFLESDFTEFDYILAVDEDVLEQLKLQAKTKEHKEKLKLAGEFSEKYPNQSIPDPYYLSGDGFEELMNMAEDISLGVFHTVLKNL